MDFITTKWLHLVFTLRFSIRQLIVSSLKLTEEQLHFIQIRVNINRNSDLHFQKEIKKKGSAVRLVQHGAHQ